MELSERNFKQLESEGFDEVYEWFDEPSKHYPAHSHSYGVSIIVSEGEVSVVTDGETVLLKSGERIDILAGQEHSVTAGKDGCKYIVGEGEG